MSCASCACGHHSYWVAVDTLCSSSPEILTHHFASLLSFVPFVVRIISYSNVRTIPHRSCRLGESAYSNASTDSFYLRHLRYPRFFFSGISLLCLRHTVWRANGATQINFLCASAPLRESFSIVVIHKRQPDSKYSISHLLSVKIRVLRFIRVLFRPMIIASKVSRKTHLAKHDLPELAFGVR